MVKINNNLLMMIKKKMLMFSIFLLLFLTTLSLRVLADTQYLTTEQFLIAHFSADVPKPTKLWLVQERAKQAEKILGHSPSQRVQRYWKQGNKTAWVLEEVGKVELITAGFVVENGKIAHVRVLTYRESRGGEVRYKAFLRQYVGVVLKEDSFLNRHIDGISGATLSVRSMSRMARLALYYDQLSMAEQSPEE